MYDKRTFEGNGLERGAAGQVEREERVQVAQRSRHCNEFAAAPKFEVP